MLPFDTTKFTTSFAFLFCYLEHDKNRYKMTNWWLKKSILFNAFTQYVHPKQKLQSCNSKCIHNTTPDVPDAKSFLQATGQREIPAADNSQTGEREPRGAAGDAEAGDPQKIEALHSLHIHSLLAYLSQQLLCSSVGFDLSSLSPDARLTWDSLLPHQFILKCFAHQALHRCD